MACISPIQNLHTLNAQVSEFPKIPSVSIFNFNPSSTSLPRLRVSIRCCLSINTPSSSSPAPVSVSENSSIEHSIEVSYLLKTFGWTPEFAISRAKHLNFKTPAKPDRVVAFFKNHGFTNTQISTIVKNRPMLLQADPENCFLPKFTFLRSIGLSRTEITSFVTQAPPLLHSSLEKRILPAFNLLRNLLRSDDEAVKMLKRHPIVLLDKLDVDSMQILLEVGVPEVNIVASMVYANRWFWPSPDNFREVVEEVKEMGIDPSRMMFLLAIRMNKTMEKSTWMDKVEVFKKYGWSDHDILLAYNKSPKFVATSKDKIVRTMDFLVNKMGIEATSIADYPNVFWFNLEKRVVPRCSIHQALLEKGLRKRKLSIRTYCDYSESKFVAMLIKRYENEAPELWDLYKKLLNSGNDLQI